MRTIGMILLSLLLVISCDDGTESLEDEVTFIVTGNEFESENNYTIFYYEYSVFPGDSFGPENLLCSENGIPFKYHIRLYNGDVVVQYPAYMGLVSREAKQPCENCVTIEQGTYIQIRTMNDEEKYTQYSIRIEE